MQLRPHLRLRLGPRSQGSLGRRIQGHPSGVAAHEEERLREGGAHLISQRTHGDIRSGKLQVDIICIESVKDKLMMPCFICGCCPNSMLPETNFSMNHMAICDPIREGGASIT